MKDKKTALTAVGAMLLAAPAMHGQEKPIPPSSWFQTDPLAKELSQLTDKEFSKFSATDLLDARPVILPTPGTIAGKNDYYMCPWTTETDGTMVVLYQRVPCHWGGDSAMTDEDSGIRMVVTSSDGGKTWSKPLDILKQAGKRWENLPFSGFGGSLGSHKGIVYAALKEGVYLSKDKGKTWQLAAPQPSFDPIPDTLWTPGGRLTFDADHGLILWSTRGFSKDQKKRMEGNYGTHLAALYSPDFGKTWHYMEQALPDGLRLSEVTTVAFDGKIAFFLRNGFKDTYYGQGYSKTGWFPFQFALSNVRSTGIVDTPDIIFNPVTRRLEVAAPHRAGDGPGPKTGMKINLYSMAPADLEKGTTDWQFDGTLLCYKKTFGKSDGFGVVGSVIDPKRNIKIFHVWGGDCQGMAGIFQYSTSLDTPAVSKYLTNFYNTGKP